MNDMTWHGKTKLWSQSTARRALMGYERTANPLPAAAALLGAVKPLAGVVKRLQSRDVRDKARFQKADALAARAALGDAAALSELDSLSRGFATQAAKDYALGKLAEVRAGRVTAGNLRDSTSPQPTVLQQLLDPRSVAALGRAAKPRRQRRARYPAYTRRDGRQVYSTKPPGSPYRLPAGAVPSPGTPYSFFRGAVGAGGAAATVGQVALAGAAGVAAYLITQRLLQHFGSKALKKEEAGVAAALAFRQARADFQMQQGRMPNKAELQQMKQAYVAQLTDLGYDPVTLTRKRSGIESFLSTYNPFD